MARWLKDVAKANGTSATGNGVRHDIPDIVKSTIADIRENGDAAVRRYSEKFDRWTPDAFELSAQAIAACIENTPTQTIKDIKQVQDNVRRFAEAQLASMNEIEIEIQPGVLLGHKNLLIDKVGAYIPGGRYPLLASAHMTILTAKVAGVREVIACTPPINGHIPNATVAAMHLAGADRIYILGGMQAVAAMAIGTPTVPRVDMIVGPGNAFVAEAKRQLYGEVGIDLFAGPTEILIIADDSANPMTVATDLLSQAEHGIDSPAVLITTSDELGQRTLDQVKQQLKTLSTAAVARESWRAFGEVVVVDSIGDAFNLGDEYASEHVQILTRNPRDALRKMKHYGALFLGENTCVSYGDKVIGTNHVLPTKKAARYTGGLWVGKFLRTVTYQEVTSSEASGQLGLLCGRASRAENFEGHARSGDLRAHTYFQKNFSWVDDAAGTNGST